MKNVGPIELSQGGRGAIFAGSLSTTLRTSARVRAVELAASTATARAILVCGAEPLRTQR